MMQKINAAADALLKKIGKAPKVGVILGSGLGEYAASLSGAVSVSYADVPGFPASTVPGHAGEFVCAKVGAGALFMRGRFHAYEGYDLGDVTLPIRVMARAGVETLVVTNAAGGVNERFSPGDLMVIEDHITFAENPLRGKNLDEFGPRFPDMSRAYDPELITLAHEIAGEMELTLRQGIYFYMRGPSFETPAEIRALRTLGADAVGMSTVPEVIVARHCGMRVLGLSCISNMAAGILDQPLSHAEVIETGEKVKDSFAGLIDGILKRLA